MKRGGSPYPVQLRSETEECRRGASIGLSPEGAQTLSLSLPLCFEVRHNWQP